MASSSHKDRGDGRGGRAHALVAVTMQEIKRRKPNQDWKTNYQALVDIAVQNTEFGTPVESIIDIFEEDPRDIHTCYPVDTTIPPTPWSWKGMLRELPDVMLEKVVGDGIKGNYLPRSQCSR